MTDAWLSCSDVAGLMGLSTAYIRELCGKGQFPGVTHDGRRWYIPSAAVAYCQKRRKVSRSTFAKVAGRAHKRISGVDRCPATCRGRVDYDCLADDRPCLMD